jgi:dihydroorotate dehydrogenase (NAD+) catalytic subunit
MSKYDLEFPTAFMNAAGSLGFAPPADHLDLARLGAFVTNPISLKPHHPTRSPQIINYPGGFLMHTGYPNLGLKAVLQRYSEQWSRLEIPVIVHLLCERVTDLQVMLTRLENTAGVIAIELGLPPQVDPNMLLALARSISGELPVIMRIPLDHVSNLTDTLAILGGEYGVAGFSLGPPRGMLPAGPKRLVHGRLFGPGLFPLALAAVQTLTRLNTPVIGGGGVYSLEQAEAMLASGAAAVQIDAALWRGQFPEK